MKTFEEKLDSYAELIMKVGVNLQKNQDLIIGAPIESIDFIRIITKKAYNLGVKHIYYRWSDDELNLIRYENAQDSEFDTFPKWVSDGYTELAKQGAAILNIYSSDPELLKNVDPNKIAKDMKTKGLAFKTYKDIITNGGSNWCIASYPTIGWSRSVITDEKDDIKIKEKMWELIFDINRVNEENPIQAWKDHFNKLEEYKSFLNNKKFKKLYYKSDKTDLVVEMSEKHIWQGANEKTKTGIEFAANMPTEEVFSMPYKYGINGKLSSTLPLQYVGNLVENFTLHFKDGKIVDFEAEKGGEILQNLLDTDEGSRYLGEIAIVPIDSPIYKSNRIFNNTLYDENASCHFAIGSAYPNCIEGGETFSKEDKEKNGMNDSIVHEDFMVGDENLSITGETADGEKICFFNNGKWQLS